MTARPGDGSTSDPGDAYGGRETHLLCHFSLSQSDELESLFIVSSVSMVRSAASVFGDRTMYHGTLVDHGAFIQSRAAFAAPDSVRSARRGVPSVRSAHEIARSRLLHGTKAGCGIAVQNGLHAVGESMYLQG